MVGTTSKTSDVPIKSFKRTKIVATVGPATDSYEAILDMIKAGANGMRLNFSHGTHEERDQHIKWIQKAAGGGRKMVAIIQDLQGPRIRLGEFAGIINVYKGQSLSFGYKTDYKRTGHIPIQYDLSKKLKRGQRIYLYDGKVRATVTSAVSGLVHARAENHGVLVKNKGINIPDTDLEGDIITAKDKEDLAYGSTKDIDYVALSFVQAVEDIRKLKRRLRTLGSQAGVIAKIETKSAVENLEAIVQEADGVMIARGDLATETSPESVPIVQRQTIELGKKYAKPTIVATQLLASMTERPEPTRAEVSDVATAVLLGADSVMLSDETASGKYPVESVRVMKRVVNYTQKHAKRPINTEFFDKKKPASQQAISQSIIGLAESLQAAAIIAETKSGATALQISSYRPDMPIIAVTSNPAVARKMAIVYGTKSYVQPDSKQQTVKLTNWLHRSRVLAKGDTVVSASGKYPGVVGTTDTIKVRVL